MTDNSAAVKALVAAVVDEKKLATPADVKAVMEAERESYAHRTTTWIHTNLTAGLSQHLQANSSRVVAVDSHVAQVQADVNELKVALAAVTAALAALDKKLPAVPHV